MGHRVQGSPDPSQAANAPLEAGGPIVCKVGEQEVSADTFCFLTRAQGGSDLASDGSANNVRFKQLTRAGWGVAQWDCVRGLHLQAYGPVPRHLSQVAVVVAHEGPSKAL